MDQTQEARARLVKKYLTDKRLRPYELEDLAGCGRGVVYDMLAGRRKLFLDTWLKLLAVMEQNI